MPVVNLINRSHVPHKGIKVPRNQTCIRVLALAKRVLSFWDNFKQVIGTHILAFHRRPRGVGLPENSVIAIQARAQFAFLVSLLHRPFRMPGTLSAFLYVLAISMRVTCLLSSSVLSKVCCYSHSPSFPSISSRMSWIFPSFSRSDIIEHNPLITLFSCNHAFHRTSTPESPFLTFSPPRLLLPILSHTRHDFSA